MKLFVANRNGAEPVDVLFRDLTIHADRISGLGTASAPSSATVVHGEPTALEAGSSSSAARRPAAASRRAATRPPRHVADLPDQVFAPIADRPAVRARLRRRSSRTSRHQVFASAPAAREGEAGAEEPKARIPLDEVESIAFERSSNLAVKFVGQPNVDTTGPGGAAGKDAKDEKKGAGDDLLGPAPGHGRRSPRSPRSSPSRTGSATST